ncbi:hypothetical protein [Burkholderia stabilis]|uniref:hypothetical protein n=1 Tax=Burkholderia stabilis TaxID=95485 RepID=UPI001F4B5C6D|nr:hypothetical protein [Burkholderia stabilis]
MRGQSASLATAEPDVFLSRWRVFETDDELKRFVGYDSVDRGRVSAALVSFDQKVLRAQTSDGLTYQLLGEPGFFWEVIDTWDIWFHSISHGEGGCVKDVTEQMCRKATGDHDV